MAEINRDDFAGHSNQNTQHYSRQDYDRVNNAFGDRDLRMWCVEQAIKILVAGRELTMADKPVGVREWTAQLEAYVLNGAPAKEKDDASGPSPFA